jgi:hypothetical protein
MIPTLSRIDPVRLWGTAVPKLESGSAPRDPLGRSRAHEGAANR